VNIYTESQIPDPGKILVRVAGEIAGERGAEAVAAEVQRVRRPDGSIVSADVSALTMAKHSPLHSLGGLLSFEQISVSGWAESGFGMLQKRSARRQVEQIWQDQGLEAAVNWAFANASKTLHLASLRDSLERNARNPMGHLEQGFRSNLERQLRKWQ
jgi:hypothetical protein